MRRLPGVQANVVAVVAPTLIRGHGYRSDGDRSRSVGDVGDGYARSPLRPNRRALENRCEHDREDGRTGGCADGSATGIRAPLSSLANHLFYGVGMAVAVALA